MAITDLTGYTWVGNVSLTRPTGDSALVYSINFTSNNNNFDTLGFPPSAFSNTMYYSGSGSTSTVYSFSGSWTADVYKTIEITGGTDVTNATLIAWLEANGTLTAPQPTITDLTGTKWLFNRTQSTSASPQFASLTMKFDFTPSTTAPITTFQATGYLRYNTYNRGSFDFPMLTQSYNPANPFINDYNYIEDNISYAITNIYITFISGDTTNVDLISWLQANATQIIEPTANTYTITHTLTNVTKGNITLQLTPDTGYELPDTITVTNGTLVSYDKTTGIAVISGDDNTSVSAECVATTPSGYNLTINYTGNMNPALRVYVNKTPVDFYTSTDYDYEFYYEDSPCVVSGLVANDYVYLLGEYGGRYDWKASSNVNCTYVDEEYGRFKVVISSDANASIDINFED